MKKSLDRYKKVDKMLHYQELLFIPKIIQTKLISWQNNKLLVEYFGINKNKELMAGNIISLILKKILKPIFKAVIFVYYLKESDISFMIICKLCQY